MDFEFDKRKSEVNKKKHGIGFFFVDAQELWEDPDHIEIPARTEDEPRYVIIGKIRGRYWSAVVTYRNKKTRNISVRRSREEEIEIYEG